MKYTSLRLPVFYMLNAAPKSIPYIVTTHCKAASRLLCRIIVAVCQWEFHAQPMTMSNALFTSKRFAHIVKRFAKIIKRFAKRERFAKMTNAQLQ